MDDDPLLQELLDLDGENESEAVGDSGVVQSSGTQFTNAATQQLGSQPAMPQNVAAAAQPSRPPSQASAQPPAAQPRPQVPQQQPAQAPPQAQAGPAAPASGRSLPKLLNSHSLGIVCSLLLKLLSQEGDTAGIQKVKSVVRTFQSQGSTLADPKVLSNPLMSKLMEVVGPEKVKQAVALQQKMRAQQAQALAAAQGQQQAPPVSKMDSLLGPHAAAGAMPPRGVSPAPARGVSPAPPMAHPSSLQPPAQAMHAQPARPPSQQLPAAPAAQPMAFNMHLQQQQQQAAAAAPAAAAAAAPMGVAQGMPVGQAPSPAMFPGSAPGVAQPPPVAMKPAAVMQPGPALVAPMMQPRPRPVAAQPKRGPEDEAGPAAKRAKGPAAGRKEKDKEGDMHDILDADAFIDMEQETDQLMAGLAQQRQLGTARLAKTQLLSEWRVANEMLRQMTKAGIKKVRPECFEILQLAFQAHASRILSKAHNITRHRHDAARKLPGMVMTFDPRRGVGQIERRERGKHDARLAAEREELLKAAQSKKADEETKEKAQKAKAELQGKQQASAANAAVAATLGKGSKWAKWDKWGGGGGAGGVGGAAGGKGKKGGKVAAKGVKEEGTVAADAAQPAAAGQAAEGGKNLSFAEPAGAEGAKAGAGALNRTGGSLQPNRSRAGLGVSGAEEGADVIHLKDVVAVLERDPMYCRSPLLYRQLNSRLA